MQCENARLASTLPPSPSLSHQKMAILAKLQELTLILVHTFPSLVSFRTAEKSLQLKSLACRYQVGKRCTFEHKPRTLADARAGFSAVEVSKASANAMLTTWIAFVHETHWKEMLPQFEREQVCLKIVDSRPDDIRGPSRVGDRLIVGWACTQPS